MTKEKADVVSKLKVDVFTVEYHSNGLLYIHANGEEITLTDYKALINSIGEMTGGEKVPILCTADEFVIPNEEVRKYMARPDSNPYSLATALITGSLAQKLVGNFFMNVLKPGRPIRMFISKEEAIKWLRSYL